MSDLKERIGNEKRCGTCEHWDGLVSGRCNAPVPFWVVKVDEELELDWTDSDDGTNCKAFQKTCATGNKFTLTDLENAIAKTKEYFKIESNDIEVTFWINDKEFIVRDINRFSIVPEMTIGLAPEPNQQKGDSKDAR